MRRRMPLVAAAVGAAVALAAPPALASQDPGRAYAPGLLAGVVVALDPGHQLGNHNWPGKVNQLVPAGGMRKPCNSTGTATKTGFPEATFTIRVARRTKSRLEGLGAQVIMTRHANTENLWGPCINERGRFGTRAGADLKISLHGDGGPSTGRGFHVIWPTWRKEWTADILPASRRLAVVAKLSLVRSGFHVATYTAGNDGLQARGDLGTLNLSGVPTVMVELGNMRNARDARVMQAAAGQARYARALVRAIRRFTSP